MMVVIVLIPTYIVEGAIRNVKVLSIYKRFRRDGWFLWGRRWFLYASYSKAEIYGHPELDIWHYREKAETYWGSTLFDSMSGAVHLRAEDGGHGGGGMTGSFDGRRDQARSSDAGLLLPAWAMPIISLPPKIFEVGDGLFTPRILKRKYTGILN